MLYKSFDCDFKINDDSGDGRTIEGYASTFGPPKDVVGDIVDKGAFKKSIRENGPKGTKRIKMLWIHDKPLGMPIELSEDDRGLHFRARVSKTQFGDDALTYIRDGVVDRMSIGYRTIKEKFNEDEQANHLKEVALMEISPVPFPANIQTEITAIKGLLDPTALAKAIIEQLKLSPTKSGLFAPENKGTVPFQNFPLAPRDRRFQRRDAETRLRSWADAEESPNDKYGRAFLWFDTAARDTFGAYKLPIADIVGDEIQAIPRAIFAAAAVISGARGGVDIPDADLETVKSNVEKYYAKMAREWDDDSIVAPWDRSADSPLSVDEKLAVEEMIADIVEPFKSLVAEPTPDGPTPGDSPTPDATPDKDTPIDDGDDNPKGIQSLIDKANRVTTQLTI
jgi:HK97 family phage prohead protease